MFKVFKPKEVIDTNPNNINNNSNKNDILDDFNKYNSNFVGVNDNSNTNRNIINNNVLKNPSSNGVYFNNQNVRTIDLNDSMMRAQAINNQNNFRQDNVISNVEYNYNNELRKHNQLDNIKKIINDGTNTQNQNIGSGESNVMQNQMFNQGVMYNQQMNNAGMYNDNIQNQMPTQFQSGRLSVYRKHRQIHPRRRGAHSCETSERKQRERDRTERRFAHAGRKEHHPQRLPDQLQPQ